MIKCLECGFETNRLQWTHFKYKCTGKFTNGTQYLKAYPGSKVVDDSVSVKTTLTKSKFIEKYGELEGVKRWDSYREKQAYSNSYEYKKNKHGWTKKQFDDYNASRAITLEKCIDRHGEERGINLWNSYVQQQIYTKTKNYLIDKYGKELGSEKYKQICKKKQAAANPKIMAEMLGISVENAIAIIIDRKISNYKFGSLLEKEFIENLEKITGKLEYTTFSRPYGKWSTLLDSYVIFDIKHNDCIVEFNGDYWHCNPKLFESTDIGPGQKTAQDIWNRDFKKIQTALDLGFRVMTVWELDYRKNKQKIIDEVAKWILSGQK